jgi:Ser/Thr protein kinase RdoA (MazF antagonist)
MLGGAGGLSGARLWRFPSQVGPLVLRAWPVPGPERGQLEWLHHWLGLAAELTFVPVPIRDRVGQTLQEHDGHFWEVSPWMPGAPDLSEPPPAQRIEAAFTALAAFHQRLACEQTHGRSPGLAQRAVLIERLVAGGFDTLEGAVDQGRRQRRSAPPHEVAARWLTLARSIAPLQAELLRAPAARVVRLQPCLRDARPEHFLFEGDRVSGLVDFGAMGVDSVAADLARLIGDWLLVDPASRALALTCYERVRPLEPSETVLIDAFESAAALLIGERWVRWHYIDGRRFDDPQAVACGLVRGLRRLERLAASRTITGLPNP